MASYNYSKLSYTFEDYDGEKSSIKLNGSQYNITTFPATLTSNNNLKEAFRKLSLGAYRGTTYSPFVEVTDDPRPTDVNAQRERKWVVRFRDASNMRIGTAEIPCARLLDDSSQPYLLPGTNIADMTHPDFVELKAAFEGAVRSIDDNAVIVLDVTLVGRNL